MTGRYLVIAGSDFYPGRGTDDWKSCHSTPEEAQASVNNLRSAKDRNGCLVHDWVVAVDLVEEIDLLLRVKP